ncbi:MAG: hypothetical protein ACK4YP_09960, partial [Myxococcota bacterium]
MPSSACAASDEPVGPRHAVPSNEACVTAECHGRTPCQRQRRWQENTLRIAVVGLGYIGSVSSGCLPRLGHRVVGLDIDRNKVSALAEG